MEIRAKGTMILRVKGRFYKVLKLRTTGDNNYTFECKDLDTKEEKTLQLNLSGLLEAADTAFKTMKNPKDIFFLDLDNNGEWKVLTEKQLSKL